MQLKNNSKFSPQEEIYNWTQIELLVKIVANKIRSVSKRYDVILGITNGGIIPARLFARELDINHLLTVQVRSRGLNEVDMPQLLDGKKYLVVDDIYDTGNTYSVVSNKVEKYNCDFAFLVRRFAASEDDGRKVYVGEVLNHRKWIVFPWEQK